MAVLLPDYRNCIANLPNSVLKALGMETVGPTLPLADSFLQHDYKNIVVLLLDGMGTKILENHLSQDGIFRKNLRGNYSSVFLPTTVAATTSAMSGLQPCEHGWLGWDMYYPQVDDNVTVFLNLLQKTKEPAADYNIAWTYTPYESSVERVNRLGGNAYASMPFLDPFPSDLDAVLERIKELCGQPERKYIYSYWSEPDGILHRFGSGAPETYGILEELQEKVSTLLDLPDTIVFITADHGHINSENVLIEDHPEINDCLVREPSLEPRALNLFVKEGKKDLFEKEFNRQFGDKFMLLTAEEVLERKLMGTAAPRNDLRGYLGDYIAIATSDLSIFCRSTIDEYASMHGGMTDDEMLIPLIVFDNKRR